MPITAAMVAKYLQTQVAPETQVVLSEWDEFDGELDEVVVLAEVMQEIAMEPERYQEGSGG